MSLAVSGAFSHAPAMPPVLGCRLDAPQLHPFDGRLNEEERWRLSTIRSSVEVAPGALLFEEGDEADCLYNVSRGVFMLYKMLPDGRRLVTDFVYPGEFVGLTFEARHACSAEAVTRTTLVRLPRRRLEGVLDRLPRLERQLFSVIRGELVGAQAHLVMLGRKTAVERVASFLMHLSKRAELRGEPAERLWVPMNRAAIGDHLGLTLETVSRTMTKLKRRRLISLRPAAAVELLEPEALSEIAEGF